MHRPTPAHKSGFLHSQLCFQWGCRSPSRAHLSSSGPSGHDRLTLELLLHVGEYWLRWMT